MTKTELIGYAAAMLTTVAFVPQTIKALKERDTKSLSLGMYTTLTTGVVLWGVYGYFRGDWAILIANLITAILSLAILITKLRNDVWGAPPAPPPA